MKLYEQLTSKHRRSIKRDLDLIFSPRGITFPQSVDDLKELGIFSPHINVKNKQIFLSKESHRALERICGFIIEETEKFRNKLDGGDVYHQVISEIENWYNRSLVPDDSEFIESLDKSLESLIDTFEFYCKVEGIKLEGINKLVIGNKEIGNYDSAIIADFRFSSKDLPNIINDEYRASLVIYGKELGSQSVALEKFYFNSELCLSIIRLYSCILYDRAIHRAQIRLVNTCFGDYGSASSFGWSTTAKDPLFTRYFKGDQDIEINDERFSYLKETCFFDVLSGLIGKEKRTELEESILKSVFWFGEAQKDRMDVSKWIKLWSCVECFFSIEDTDITEANARGISALLVYGGFKLGGYDDYENIKTKIKKYYGLRSKAIHRAEFNHLEKKTLEEFSFIVAWVIILMTSLSIQGYVNLDQVRVQAMRLDNINQSK